MNHSGDLGIGIGLRRAFFNEILQNNRDIDWLEIVPENFITFGGRPRDTLKKCLARWPIISHGVGLSLGAVTPFSPDYLQGLKNLLDQLDSPFFSDHLCYSSYGNHQYHDLIPLPFTEESVTHTVERIDQIRDKMKRPLVIENISYYIASENPEMDEATFITEILKRSDAGLLLDINNVYVNSKNHGFDAKEFLAKLPTDKVVQIHLAGHWDRGDVVIDTHGAAVCQDVWELYAWYTSYAKRSISTLIEWDNDIPPLSMILDEAKKAKQVRATALKGSE